MDSNESTHTKRKQKRKLNIFAFAFARSALVFTCKQSFSSNSIEFMYTVIAIIFVHRKVFAVMTFALVCTVMFPVITRVILILHVEPSTVQHADPRSGATMVTVATTQELQSFLIKIVKLT